MTHKFKKGRKYRKMTREITEFMWNHDIYGWVYIPKPIKAKKSNKKISVVFFEIFELANEIYQNERTFSFKSRIGKHKDMAELMGCSVSTIAGAIKTAGNKWKYFYQKERERLSGMDEQQIEIYFWYREEIKSYADELTMIDEDTEKYLESFVLDRPVEDRSLDELTVIAGQALKSLIHVRDLKERRK